MKLRQQEQEATACTVNRSICNVIASMGEVTNAMALANLYGDILYWNSRRVRWCAGAYSRTYFCTDNRVRAHLRRLEGLGALLREGPPQYPQWVALPLPWSPPAPLTGEDPSAPADKTPPHSTQSHIHSHNHNQISIEDQKRILSLWCSLAPSHWVQHQTLSEKAVQVVCGYISRYGSLDAFLSQLQWQLNRARKSPMGKPDSSRPKPTILTLLGMSAKQNKERWDLWAEENPEGGMTPHSLKSPAPDQHPLYKPHWIERDYSPQIRRPLILRDGAQQSEPFRSMSTEERLAAHQEAWALYTDHPPIPDDELLRSAHFPTS